MSKIISMRKCPRCQKNLTPESFYTDNSKTPPLSSWCRACTKTGAGIRLLDLRTNPTRGPVVSEWKCSICHVVKKTSEFHRKSLSRLGISSSCKSCRNKLQTERRNPIKNKLNSLRWKTTTIARSPERFLWLRMKWNAKARGVKFEIQPEDLEIPEFCEVLGVRLKVFKPESSGKRRPHPRSASIDRIDSSKGYVKGNVKVISHLANLIKNIGTIEQHERVIAYMKKYGQK